jgi:2',3'-cyclic-nucleotide 2'-phosphodiesterase (5'-nucleotidase family)
MLAYWKHVESYKPDKFLVLSCGDIASGPAISTMYNGNPVIKIMNLMGYDATALGNHEFEFSMDEWKKLAKFPILAANIVRKSTGLNDLTQPYVIINQEGIKVALVGLTTADLHEMTSEADDYELIPYADALRKVVPQARKEGAEVIIVVSHAWEGDLVALADNVKDLNIALMLGGHSHSLYQNKVGDTWVVLSGAAWRTYTRIDMDYNPSNNKTIVLSSKQVWLQQDKPKIDDRVESERKYWRTKIDKDYGVYLAHTITGFDLPDLYKLVNGCWLASDPSADVALNNDGGLRQSIIDVMPFKNSLYRIRLTGEQLIGYLPGNVAAGLRKEGDKYILVKTSKQVDPKATYNVLINNYMYDTNEMLQNADPSPVVIASDWRQPLYDWLLAHPTNKDKPLERVIKDLPK